MGIPQIDAMPMILLCITSLIGVIFTSTKVYFF